MTVRRFLPLGAALAATAAAAALAAGPARADSPDPASAVIGQASAPGQVAQYWTAEAMADALPTPEPAESPDDTAPAASTRTESGGGSAPAAVAPAATVEPYALTKFSASKIWSNHSSMPATSIGKLYYTNGGSRYWCTATVINSANRSTVWTAGHCISNGNGGWYSNFLFAPDYYDAKWPYGTWSGKSWAVPEGYFHGKKHNYDMGAIALSTNSSGKKVGDVVGWQGYKFGDGYRGTVWQDVRSFGYPMETHPKRSGISPYGHDLRFCVSNAVPYSIYQMIDCDMGGGSSGGPWIQDLPLSRGWGYIIGHNDFHTDGGQATEESPQLGDAAINARAAVQSN